MKIIPTVIINSSFRVKIPIKILIMSKFNNINYIMVPQGNLLFKNLVLSNKMKKI